MNWLLRNGIEGGKRRKGKSRGGCFESRLEDLSLLSLGLFKRLIYAMKDEDLGPEIVESCLMHYAKKIYHWCLESEPKTKASNFFFFLILCAIGERAERSS